MNSADVPFLRQITVPPPAAGADWRFSSGGDAVRRVVAMRAVLTTSAAVATRLPSLTLADGTDTFATVPPSAGITASKAGVVSSIPGAPSVGVADGPLLLSAPTDGWMLLPGWSLGVVTAALDAADQWSAIRLWVVDYPTGGDTRITPDVFAFVEPR